MSAVGELSYLEEINSQHSYKSSHDSFIMGKCCMCPLLWFVPSGATSPIPLFLACNDNKGFFSIIWEEPFFSFSIYLIQKYIMNVDTEILHSHSEYFGVHTIVGQSQTGNR